MAPELAERVETAWTQSKQSHRIGVSEFTHGRKWRPELIECGVMEIYDRDNTLAWLVSYECMDAIMLRIQELEDMLEESSTRAMIRTRADTAVFKNGPEAAEEAIEFFMDRYGHLFEDVEIHDDAE